VPILEVGQLRSPPPMAILLAAVGAGVALGLTPHAIRDGVAAVLDLRAAQPSHSTV